MKYFNDNNDMIVNEAYNKIYGKIPIILNEGGLGIITGGVLGFLAGGPIGAIAGAYLGHKAQEIGIKKFLKNVIAITGGAFLGNVVGGPLGALAGMYAGFSIASKESTMNESNNKKIDDKELSKIFEELIKNLDIFLKEKSMASLKTVYKSIKNINTTFIINRLSDDQKQRLVKIYIFIASLYELSNSDHRDDRIKYEKILKLSSDDIVATTVNLFGKK